MSGRIVVLSGLPGTGKSTLADGIGRACRLPVLSVDPIESAVLRAGIARSFETGLAAYLVVKALADTCLATGLDPVIDAVNAVDPAREMWRALARAHDAELRVIECIVSNRSVHEARVRSRDRGLDLPEPTWEAVLEREAEWSPWPEPHLTLDACDDPGSNLERALAFLA